MATLSGVVVSIVAHVVLLASVSSTTSTVARELFALEAAVQQLYDHGYGHGIGTVSQGGWQLVRTYGDLENVGAGYGGACESGSATGYGGDGKHGGGGGGGIVGGAGCGNGVGGETGYGGGASEPRGGYGSGSGTGGSGSGGGAGYGAGGEHGGGCDAGDGTDGGAGYDAGGENGGRYGGGGYGTGLPSFIIVVIQNFTRGAI